MTSAHVFLRRIAALSVVITLVAAPIASAQAPEGAPPSSAPANTTLLNEVAFARLVQPPPVVAPAPVLKSTPRLDLLHQATAVMARQAQTAPTKARDRSWVSRHKWAIIVPAIVGGAMLGAYAGLTVVSCNTGC